MKRMGSRAHRLGSCSSQALKLRLGSCSSRALKLRLGSCGPWVWLLHHMWDLPGSRSGIEPMFPALLGGLFTTEPRGKPCFVLFCFSPEKNLLEIWLQGRALESPRLNSWFYTCDWQNLVDISKALCARNCAKHLIYINIFNPYNNTKMKVLLLLPFYT